MVSVDVTLETTIGGFDLRIDFRTEGGITALFGPSGAGKTLTLRAIAGLHRPRIGRVVVSGRTLFDSSTGVDVPARDRRIGYVFQQYALFPHLDVAANIAFGLQGLRPADRKERIESLLELIGLQGLEGRYPRELSGGQQQRVALVRALAAHPDLVLLDEPFAAVDHRVRRRLREEMQRIQEVTGTPMILVTHEIAEVRQLADHLVVIDAGSVVQAGPAAIVLAHPTPDALELIGEQIGR